MSNPGEPLDPRDELQQAGAATPADAARLLEALPVPVFVLEDHRVIFVNDAQARLLGGATAADVTGSRIDKFVSADTRERFLRALDEVASQVGTSQTITEKFVRLDGRALNIEYVVKSVAYDGRTAIEGVLRKVILAEASAAPQEEPKAKRKWFGRREKRAERRPVEGTPRAPLPAESAFMQAVEALPDGVYWLDDTGICRFINRAGAEILGCDPDEIIGKRFHDLTHYRTASGELVNADDCPLHTTRGTIEPKQNQFDAMWRWDGSSVPVVTSTAPLAGGGRVVSFRAIEEEVPTVSVRQVDREVARALAEERRVSADALTAAVKRERVAAEERLQEAVEHERKRTGKAVDEAVRTFEVRIKDLQKRFHDAPEQEKKKVARAVEEAVEAERDAAEKRLREAVEQERKRTAKAIEEAVAAERRAGEARGRDIDERARENTARAVQEALASERRASEAKLAEALEREVHARAEAVAAAVAAGKRAVRDAVATERSLAESAVRDAAKVAAERALRESQDASQAVVEQKIRAAVDEVVARERESARQLVAATHQEAEARVATERARLAEERERANQALNEALAAERSRADDEVLNAVAEAREAALKTMEEARITAARELEQSIRAEAARQTEAALAAERRAAQTAIDSAIEAERAKFNAALRQVAEDSKRATAQAVQQALDMDRVAAAKAVKDAVVSARAAWERERAAEPPVDPVTGQLLNSMAEGVYGLDLDGRFTHLNRAAAQMFGYAPEKLIGQSAHQMIHSRRRDGSPYPLSECAIHSGVRLGHINSGDDEVFWTRKGASFPIDYSYAPLYRGSEIAGGVVTFKDITERKLAGQEAAQADRMSSLGRFAAATTHEFDKVLQGIRGAAEVIRWHNSGDELENAKAQLVRMLERGSHLIRQISRFTETREAEPKPIELVDWFQSFLQAARVALRENIELNFRLPDETLYVHADPGQLNQIFMNLVLNARDAMPNGGRLTLSIDSCLSGSTYSFGVVPTPDRFIHFMVEDTGVGIPPELMSRVFEPLFTTKGSGTAGMGLAICHQLVRKLGGSIFVESTVGTGTRFHIFLPAAYPEIQDTPVEKPKAAAPPAPQPAPTVIDAPPPGPQRKRIVVINTEDFTADQKRAAADGGVDIEVVYGGTEAAERIQFSAPDALLMEITWMEADGVDIYRDIATRWPKLPIIVSTAKIHEVKIKGGVPSLPNVRYLPYDLPTLLKWVEGPRK